ncbi:MAG: hypothetical protein IKW95_01675 [Lachnospiraceae bacterium]|nr:hypothetical protein [Lachnospiraceae bacterium]
MKEKQKQNRSSEPLSREMLLRRNPIPFGDVRKYYYAGMIGTIVLLAVCFYVCVSAIALRTDTCVQIPNGIVIILLLCAVFSIVGHYSRTIAGYVLSASMCLVIVLVLQLYNGGIALQSELPDYGEVVKDGMKGLDFWILLAKALAVVHMLLSVVFINSTLKVKEEPPVKGMNIKIKQFCEWFARKDEVNGLGWRPSQFWMACASLILWMLAAQANPFSTNKYDCIAMAFVLIGAALVFIGKAFLGSLCLLEGFLTCCTMYQLRFGWSVPTVASYVGAWFALLFLLLEAYRRKNAVGGDEWSLRLGDRFAVRIPVADGQIGRCAAVWRKICISGAVVIAMLMLPIHEFLSAFSGSYMNQPKDNLPLYFFLPLAMLICAWGGSALGYFCAGVLAIFLYDAINDVSATGLRFFLFNSTEQHGFIGDALTDRMNGYVFITACLILLFFVVCMITAVCFARRKYEGTEVSANN